MAVWAVIPDPTLPPVENQAGHAFFNRFSGIMSSNQVVF